MPRGGYRLVGLGAAWPFDRQSSLARVRRERLEQVGLEVALADQAHAGPVAMNVPGDLVTSKARVAREDEASLEGPQDHDSQELGRDPSGNVVRAAPLLIVLLAAVQVHQHGQRPGAIRPVLLRP